MNLQEYENHPDGRSGVTMFANQYCYNGNEGVKKFIDVLSAATSVYDLPTPLFPLPLYSEKYKNSGVPVWGGLHHYTSVETLLSIIQGAHKREDFTLHLSRIDYTNDFSEGGDIFSSVLKEVVSKSDYEDFYAADYFPVWKNKSKIRNTYAFSLSVDRDSLPLWQSYSNKGVGYNIAFNANALYSACVKEGVFLLPVIYDCNLMYRLTKFVLEKLNELCINSLNNDPRENHDIENKIWEFISLAQRSFKHPSYSYEREVRIVKIVDKSTLDFSENYKHQKGVLKPYTEISLPKDIIGGVTVGPLVEAEIAKRTVEDALRTYGFWIDKTNVHMPSVVISQAPVRFL
ncbi:MAG: DUF2971 domain-containing protein [Betaproteobacteria bacterium]|nr:DUF2971 domain-containing protein [Betaproteobacteria bacterium]